MKTPRVLSLFVAILTCAVVDRCARRLNLPGRTSHPMLQGIPGTITMGAYLGFAVAGATNLYLHIRTTGSILSGIVSRHGLLFLLMIVFCMDLTLNNYMELSGTLPPSYGLVYLIDITIWTLMACTLSAYGPTPGCEYRPWFIPTAIPVLPLLRQFASPRAFEFGPSLIDTAVLAILVGTWVLLPFPPRATLAWRIGRLLLLACVWYGLLLVLEDAPFRFLSPGLIDAWRTEIGGGIFNLLRFGLSGVLAVLTSAIPHVRQAFAAHCTGPTTKSAA